ncbi:hypothetical protein OG455_26115 [Kitasatospora sp. NBC_01287]|uniref:hypothetical protein n=1 Tax=Kitasatospora sp. NBC_01287 TaxID=2903573 RepID=UPI00224FF20B|nr:hypothetical protein [Kitasatospora sp. NBC_01287]MCX4748948.1 hypothetical protein [Kitasatospora sp. NBC_01287]
MVDIAVHPSALRTVGIDAADFPDRSAVDPGAVVVLRAQTAHGPEASVRLSEGTAVFTSSPEVPLDELLATYGDWPMVLRPRPRRGPTSPELPSRCCWPNLLTLVPRA